MLRKNVVQHPGETLDAVTRLLHERCGVTVLGTTVRRARYEAGIQRSAHRLRSAAQALGC